MKQSGRFVSVVFLAESLKLNSAAYVNNYAKAVGGKRCLRPSLLRILYAPMSENQKATIGLDDNGFKKRIVFKTRGVWLETAFCGLRHK